jgi:hypothetical protein
MAETPQLGKVLVAALEVQSFCEAKGWKYCFIGGLALQPWGNPRATQDADLTLLTGFSNEEGFVDELIKVFRLRRPDGRDFALRHRVLLLWSTEGVGIDIGLGALPFEERSIQRSKICLLAPGHSLRVCCAEDLIVHKAFAARDQDWADVDMILLRQGNSLNINQIFEELTPLAALKEDNEIIPRLSKMMRNRGLIGGAA